MGWPNLTMRQCPEQEQGTTWLYYDWTLGQQHVTYVILAVAGSFGGGGVF